MCGRVEAHDDAVFVCRCRITTHILRPDHLTYHTRPHTTTGKPALPLEIPTP